MAENNSSTEITSKIRAAIKAKLTELGAYVDEELPDYIMVMIANKKTKQQMTEDLNLFLGKNSTLFTEWLQNVLDRLQSISRSSSGSSSTVVHAVSQTVASSAKSQEIEKPSKIRKSPERKKRSPPPRRHRDHRRVPSSHHRTRRDSKRVWDSSSDNYASPSSDPDEEPPRRKEKKETRREEKIIKKLEKPHVTPPPREETSNAKIMTETTMASEVMATAEKAVHAKQQQLIDEDVLVVRAEVEEGDELAEMAVRKPASIEKKSTTITTRPHATGQPQRTVTIEETKLAGRCVTPPIATSSVRKPIEAPSPDGYGYGRRHVGTVRPMKRRTPSPDEGPSRKRRSAIGQVVQRPEFRDDNALNEEYDPLRPQLSLQSTTASVASTVHITERKYTVPREMQPKPSIFLRALNEANRSVQLVGSHRAGRQVEKAEDRGSSTIESTSRKLKSGRSGDEAGLSMGGSSRGVFDRLIQDVPAKTDEIEARNRLDNLKSVSRRVERRQTESVATVVSSQENTSTIAEDELIIDSSPDNEKPKSDSKTRFIVTMTGVDRKFAERTKSNDEDKKPIKIIEEDEDFDDMDTLIVDVNEEELMEEEAMVAYSESNKKAAAFGSGRGPGQQIVNPIKISLDDDDDDDDIPLLKPSETVVVASATPTGSNESVAGSPRIMDDVPLAGMGRLPPVTLESSIGGGKIMERCRFWPNCQFGASCQYLHPTAPCKNFPQCRFGVKCLYIHPPCRFDPYCKNPRCAFSHSHSAAQLGSIDTGYGDPRFSSAIQQGTNSFIPCKFGGRCMNALCPYRHPQAPCMYGIGCTKSNCTYSHRSPITTPLTSPPYQQSRPISTRRSSAGIKGGSAKFRWVAPQTNSGGSIDATSTPVAKIEEPVDVSNANSA